MDVLQSYPGGAGFCKFVQVLLGKSFGLPESGTQELYLSWWLDGAPQSSYFRSSEIGLDPDPHLKKNRMERDYNQCPIWRMSQRQ